MKLYNVNLSPIAARCRIQIYAKGLDIEMVEPPGGVSSLEYKQINPTGKVPALEVDGEVIPESHAICSFLEQRFPEPSLLPGDDINCARMWALAQMADLYVLPPVVRLGHQLPPNELDPEVVQTAVADIEIAVDRVEAFMSQGPYALGEVFSVADCSLAPVFLLTTHTPPAAGVANPLDSRPKLQAWWDVVRQHEAVARVFTELST